MQIPSQISFKNMTPRGGKLTAGWEGNDLPNIVQVKGTNDIAKVRRSREHERPASWGPVDERDEREDDDEYDRDEHGCHKHTNAAWDSKCKYTSLRQTLLFIKKRNCTRVVVEAKYDDQGKLIVVTPKVTLDASASSITTPDNKRVEMRWKSNEEVLVREYSCEVKKSTESAWTQFDMELPMGAGTAYLSIDAPTESGSYDYRLVAKFSEGAADQVLLSQPGLQITVQQGASEVSGFTPAYNPDTGSIDVSWTSVREIAVIDYYVQVKPSAEPDTSFADVEPPVEPIGENQPYVYQMFLDGTDYTVRLRSVFQDGSDTIVANTTKVVQVPATA